MKKILVVLDKPKHEQIALQRALRLATDAEVRLHLVSFVYEPLLATPGIHHVHEDLTAELIRSRENWLNELRDQFQLPPHTESKVVWHHSIASWTLETLQTESYDLVIKTAQKQFGSAGYGSIDWQLIERSPVPLWLAVNTPWIKRDRLVAAVDPEQSNPLHQTLNRKVLAAGDSLAKKLGAKLEVVASLPLPGLLAELGLEEKPADLSDRLQALREHLETLIDDSGVSCSKLHLVTGKPAREVNRIVDRNKASLMLVGRGVRKGVTGFLLGNTAERILSKANTDVLVLP